MVGIFIPCLEKVAVGGLTKGWGEFFFSGRKALRNTPFPKCHKGLRIDPVTESDPAVPQNERSIKGKWHLGGPSLPKHVTDPEAAPVPSGEALVQPAPTRHMT